MCYSQEELRGKETPNAIITSLVVIDILPALWTIAGNAICIFTFAKTRSLHTPSNTLVGALCVTDLYAGLVLQPLLLTSCLMIPTNTDISRMVTSLATCLYFGGQLSFALTYLVTIDRYIAICHPFRYTEFVTIRKYLYVVSITVFSCFMTTAFDIYYRRGAYVSSLAIQGLMTPQVVICYMLISRAICRQRKVQVSVGNIEGQDRAQIRKHKEDKRKAYTIGIIVVTYLVCCGPQMVVYLFILDVKDSYCNFSSNNFTISIGLHVLFLLNSVINPIVYSLRIKEIRNAACRLVRKKATVVQQTASQA